MGAQNNKDEGLAMTHAPCLCEARQRRSKLSAGKELVAMTGRRITLKGRATKREVPDKSGNYKNSGQRKVVLGGYYTLSILPISFSTSLRSLQESSTALPLMIPLR